MPENVALEGSSDKNHVFGVYRLESDHRVEVLNLEHVLEKT
jgi:hypothetical protein